MANNNRRSSDLLPVFYRTEKNSKFLSSTLDQLISVPKLTRIDSYVGSKKTPTYLPTDSYISEQDPLREAYQLEPSLIVRDINQEIKKTFALDDALNQINSYSGNSSDLNRTFEPKFYSYDPHIDWDKFINFKEYYWLVSGPPTLPISGIKLNSRTEFSVTDADDKIQFFFNKLTTTEQLTLYRGATYVFNINSVNNFYIKNAAIEGFNDQYNKGIKNNGIKNGQIIFNVDWAAPDRLYYVSENNILSLGVINIKDPIEDAYINVDKEIIGKINYTSSTGIKFINGLKIKFTGVVFPEKYREEEFIVEGVGSSIKLIKFRNLETPDSVADLYNTTFDGTNFDEFPFDNFKNIPLVPEYITINKASDDLNPWSRYNRWFHSDVIELSARYNNEIPVYPSEYRAKRPIVEFLSNLQLYNFGSKAIDNVDLIDTTTENVFYTFENRDGFYIDGVLVEEGFRIIFSADADPLVKGKIFKVHFSIINGKSKIDLIPESDIVIDNSSVLIKKGTINSGSSWYYSNDNWIKSQQRTHRNQEPLFDLFDKNGNSYTTGKYYTSNFKGNKIFGYGIGNGINDKVLGFPLLYKNVGIEGTYVFKNYFSTDNFLITGEALTTTILTAQTYFKINSNPEELKNIWVSTTSYSIPQQENGAYDVPLNLTNNPLNSFISEFTLTELSSHVKTMTLRDPLFEGVFPGLGNIKDLSNMSKYGTLLISNINPVSFMHHFITDNDNSIINATRLVGEHYYQFKLNLLKSISSVNQTISSVDALEAALASLNDNKTTLFPYYYSDMLPYGNNAIVRNYKIKDSYNKTYGLPAEFNIKKLSTIAVLIYLNGEQLLIDNDYIFDEYDTTFTLLCSINKDDIVTIKFYPTTNGSFIPPTPTKLGLYPKFIPEIYLDNTFADAPRYVIQGHDGSLTIAFGDYRDNILLEYEKRIFNNIKTEYRSDLFDINSIFPGSFRNNNFSNTELLSPITSDFLKWKTTYNVEIEKNLTFNISNHKTFNYSNIQMSTGEFLPGNWRAIFKRYFDTDRPHTHPWEMLGFYICPTWWENIYGPAPYTSENVLLWDDLELGRIASGPNAGINSTYARPGLSKILPVDDQGNIVDIRSWGIVGSSASLENADAIWKFGDLGPSEASWRRSVYWPFAVQIIMALYKPATYSSLLFDTSRMVNNSIGQIVYSEDNLFLNHSKVLLPYTTVNDKFILTSGYSVFVIEAGLIKNENYLEELSSNLKYSNFNLMNKVGGFVSKDKLQVTIDSVNPNSISPGALLPEEDYDIHFNVSNPIKIINISGIIIQKRNNYYVVRGYDNSKPYFNIFEPIHQNSDYYIKVGGKSEDYAPWSQKTFYSIGQVILYNDLFYRSTNNHNSGIIFDIKNYSKLLELPVINSIVSQYPSTFSNTVIKIPYGTTYSSIQEVTDFIAGYGSWLQSQGFIFDGYNEVLKEVLDWKLTIKEFLFWSSQNWAENSVITVSPFAGQIKLTLERSAVDDIFNSFYEYSLLTANGTHLPKENISVSRVDGVCSITLKNSETGIYFASLRLVQKEHSLIFKNKSRFNDIIYDIETGYRQRRILLTGFRTAEWNGDFYSPGFIYDSAKIKKWKPYEDYIAGDVIEYASNYYSLDRNLPGKKTIDFTEWNKLGSKPVAGLIPNFEYKVTQFEDFYSLDIDNFDISQQTLAQHLTGYSPRTYLNNIIYNPIAQYKFFQGFIKEKGTRNAIDKLARASIYNLQGKINFNEEWAFRIGKFGAYSSLQEIEFLLNESKFIDNTQLVKFVDTIPNLSYDTTIYIRDKDLIIIPEDYSSEFTFPVSTDGFDYTQFELPVAGYPRVDDVDFISLSKGSLSSVISNSNKKVAPGDTVWIGIDDDGDWNTYRYVRIKAVVTDIFDDNPGYTLGLTTDRHHGLHIGDVISIINFDPDLDGVYTIKFIPRLNQFIIDTPISFITNINTAGSMFKLYPSRFENFDELATVNFLADIRYGKKIWIDSNTDGHWEVYEKLDNYNSNILKNPFIVDSAEFGKKIVSKEESSLLLISSPGVFDYLNIPSIHLYANIEGNMTKLFGYTLNRYPNEFYTEVLGDGIRFGESIDYDSTDGVIVAGAPYISTAKSDPSGTTRFAMPLNTPNSYTYEGLVTISTINVGGTGELRHSTLACQSPESYVQFGTSVFISNTEIHKILLVGAPGYSSGKGAVFSYDLTYYKSFDGLTIEVKTTATSQIKLPDPVGLANASGFGTTIAGNKLGTRIATSAPGAYSNTGAVHVYTKPSSTSVYSFIQTLRWNDAELGGAITTGNSQFGYDIDMDDSGDWLFVSAYSAPDAYLETGKIIVYRWNGIQFVKSQIINNPSSIDGLQFGHSIESDASGNILTVTSRGPNYFSSMTFDGNTTGFDVESTQFGTSLTNSGAAYIYNRYNDKFIFSTELINSTVGNNGHYGLTVSVNRNSIYVSAPNYIVSTTHNIGAVYVWDAIDPTLNSWNLLRTQSQMVDVTKIKQIKTIDNSRDSVKDYLELYDPAKGKIPRIADDEIRFKAIFDPAIYSTAEISSVTADIDSCWKSEHVGELWWDLSSLKYVWYEQGEIEYRKNIWGNLFPGASVDIYEWVSSTYSPGQWALMADTNDGLSKSISGQPKYLDTAYTVETIYSSVTGSYTNLYYFWVKNSTIVPHRQGRSISAFDVAGLILNPKYNDIKYIQALSPNSLSVINVKDTLINERISLNIQLDDVDNTNNKHTEWLLLEEGSAYSLPNLMLENKMIDSLMGRDRLGNEVPDSFLSDRQKYGIEIRPRQSMFKNRYTALRNIIEFTNTVFLENLITDFYDLTTLYKKEEIPETVSREYDIVVDNIEERDLINYKTFIKADLSCTVNNGKIINVIINNPGFGYGKLIPITYDNLGNAILWKGPNVTIMGNNTSGLIETEIDSLGKIISIKISKQGENYSFAPALYVRPYALIVRSDINSQGRWSKYELLNNEWKKTQTQSFNTALYWDFIDWYSPTFNKYKVLSAIIEETYQLESIEVDPLSYVKVKNNGAGRYIILEKIKPGQTGTYNVDYNIVFSENGTIKLHDIIWNTNLISNGFDQISPYDKTSFDQSPDLELENIIFALRDNIFVGNLKIYWNKLFFTSVKYALTEQKFIDWAFKTSFISVNNRAGELKQLPVYKFQDTQWYENYLKEVKPYHTQLRNYEVVYDILEPSNTNITDFDLPVSYNKETNKFSMLELTDPKLLNYPYDVWNTHHKLHVDSIVVVNSGEEYLGIPTVQIIASPADINVTTATAIAIISNGIVDRIEVVNPGEGYTETPTVLLVGGTSVNFATASAIMSNNKVRTNNIRMKFDRISLRGSTFTKIVNDQFISSGVDYEYILSWPAMQDKTEIYLKINGAVAPQSVFEIEDFFSTTYGYKKRYTKLLLNYAPNKGYIINVTYSKSIEIYSAYDRITNYYTPTLTNPGSNDLENNTQLMRGMEYPGTEIQTEALTHNFSWDATPFNSTTWDKLNFSTSDFDTLIDGGNLTTSSINVFSSASGISPSDIILDGDTFISPERSYAPEELVPGELHETLGINVFTRRVSGSPTIYTQIQESIADTDTIIHLKIIPAGTGSISVTADRKLLINFRDYTIDFSTGIITINPLGTDATIAVTYMDVGGSGFINMSHQVSEGADGCSVLGNCLYEQVKSVYVTLDGTTIYSSEDEPVYYKLTESDPGIDNRAKVTVYGIGTLGRKTVTAAFFTSKFKGFNEIHETTYYNLTDSERVITLSNPPGGTGHSTANCIVEVNGVRLIPPDTTYYPISDVSKTTYLISDKKTFPANTFDKTTIEVYKNGKVISPSDYFLDDINNQIIFPQDTFVIGDGLSITGLVDYDYRIKDKLYLILTQRVTLPIINVVRVLTFNNATHSIITTEVFPSNSARLYKLVRQVINDNFIWVSIGGKTLTSGVDFELFENNRTIQVDTNIPYVKKEEIIIMSFSSDVSGGTTGFRIFKDVLGRNHYKRLSQAGTAYLVAPLQIMDTIIEVNNGDVLPYPDISSNIPGIILIAGERIEYLTKHGNILSNIKRATLGTGARDYYSEGTWVIDQGISQNIPFAENIRVETFTTSTNIRPINTSTFSFIQDVSLHDQIDVYYGGKLLQKSTKSSVYIQDTNIYYDPVNMTTRNPDFIITGTITTATLTLSFTPSVNTEITMVQRLTSSWYQLGRNVTLFDQQTIQANFINETEAVPIDNMYYGDDNVLKFDDGTSLRLDDGNPIKGY